MAARNTFTAKQQRFVSDYLIDLNARQAANRAGYSAKMVKVMGAENLTKPNIASAIALAQAERSARTTGTAHGVGDSATVILG